MKSFLLCVVLAAAVLASGAELEDPTSGVDLSNKEIVPLRTLLFRTTLFTRPVPNISLYEDVVFRGDGRTRINNIIGREIGVSQGVQLFLLSGGVGNTHATIRVMSARGRGYHLELEIWS